MADIDDYFASVSCWPDEVRRLREVLNATELTEDFKWGGPCYTFAGKNVVGIGSFKSYFGLWFHHGALLRDENGVLINAQEGKTRALRQWRMTSAADIKPAIIKRYVKEAIKLVRDDRQIRPALKKPLEIPAQLRTALQTNKVAAAAFDRLRIGQQREYAEYIAEARREDTKTRRIDRILPLIAHGKGLNDRYR